MSQRAACPYYSTCEPSGDRRAGRTRSSHSLIAFVPCLMMNLAFPEWLACAVEQAEALPAESGEFASEVMSPLRESLVDRCQDTASGARPKRSRATRQA
jgi:hypothetical protein